MNILKTALHEKKRLLRQKTMLQEKIDVLPAGRLSIEKNGRWDKWFRTIKTEHSVTREYIPKSDQAAAEQLALKKYLEEELAAIDIQLHILCAFIESYPSSPDFRPFQEEGLKELLPPSLMEKEQKTERWMAESYEKSMEHPESLRIPTKTGADDVCLPSLLHRLPMQEWHKPDLCLLYQKSDI